MGVYLFPEPGSAFLEADKVRVLCDNRLGQVLKSDVALVHLKPHVVGQKGEGLWSRRGQAEGRRLFKQRRWWCRGLVFLLSLLFL